MNSPENKILIYTFFNLFSKCNRVVRLLEIEGVNKMYVQNLQDIYKLAKHIEYRNYDYVLGIGDGLKRSSKIRIEQKFINLYRNSPINKSGSDSYVTTWDLPLLENCVVSEKPTNGRCNRVAYIVSKYVEDADLATKAAYVHIPGMLSDSEIREHIKTWISLEMRS